jgi:hypothetical protein
MEILLWLLPTAVVAVVMMAWASWAGRPRRERGDRSEAAYERFAAAIARDHPGSPPPRPVARDRSTGIAIRPSRRGGPAGTGVAGATRRSA